MSFRRAARPRRPRCAPKGHAGLPPRPGARVKICGAPLGAKRPPQGGSTLRRAPGPGSAAEGDWRCDRAGGAKAHHEDARAGRSRILSPLLSVCAVALGERRSVLEISRLEVARQRMFRVAKGMLEDAAFQRPWNFSCFWMNAFESWKPGQQRLDPGRDRIVGNRDRRFRELDPGSEARVEMRGIDEFDALGIADVGETAPSSASARPRKTQCRDLQPYDQKRRPTTHQDHTVFDAPLLRDPMASRSARAARIRVQQHKQQPLGAEIDDDRFASLPAVECIAHSDVTIVEGAALLLDG